MHLNESMVYVLEGLEGGIRRGNDVIIYNLNSKEYFLELKDFVSQVQYFFIFSEYLVTLW